MFEDCPFNYAIAKTKGMYFLVKTKYKLKYPILLINIFHLMLIVSFIKKHHNDKFDTLITTIYLSIIWISVLVSFYFLTQNIPYIQQKC